MGTPLRVALLSTVLALFAAPAARASEEMFFVGRDGEERFGVFIQTKGRDDGKVMIEQAFVVRAGDQVVVAAEFEVLSNNDTCLSPVRIEGRLAEGPGQVVELEGAVEGGELRVRITARGADGQPEEETQTTEVSARTVPLFAIVQVVAQLPVDTAPVQFEQLTLELRAQKGKTLRYAGQVGDQGRTLHKFVVERDGREEEHYLLDEAHQVQAIVFRGGETRLDRVSEERFEQDVCTREQFRAAFGGR